MGDVDFKMFIMVGFTGVTVQCEGFPLDGKGGVGDEVGEGVATPGLVGWEQMWGNGMMDKSGKGGGEVVRRDVGCRKVMWVVRWDMGSV